MPTPAALAITPPPSDVQAEIDVLALILYRPDRLEHIAETLSAADLYHDRHRALYAHLLDLQARECPMDMPGIVDEAERLGRLDAIGGANFDYPYALVGQREDHLPLYCARIRRAALRRRLIAAAQGVVMATVAGEINGQADKIPALVAELHALDDPVAAGPGPSLYADALTEARRIRATPGIASSIPGLDAVRYRSGHTIIVGAFTSHGKTMLACREAIYHASAGRPTLFLSLEMSSAESAMRIEESAEDPACDQEGRPLPLLWIEDRWSQLPDILRVIGAWHRARDPEQQCVVVLDYLQKIGNSAAQTREREIASVAEALQRQARQLGYILFSGAQLNRMSQSEDAGPSLHHLRESGLIEQVGDAVLLVQKLDDGHIRVHVAKNRWGTSGVKIELACDFARCRMSVIPLNEQWGPLAAAVLAWMKNKSGPVDLRTASQRVRFNGAHPGAADIGMAGQVTGLYSVEDGIIRPT